MLFRRALQAAHGYEQDVARAFTAHSFRRGASIFRLNRGMPEELCLQIDQWKTPSVEAGYHRDWRRTMQQVQG